MKQKVYATITIEYEVEVDYPDSWNYYEIENDLENRYEEYIDEDNKSVHVSFETETFRDEPDRYDEYRDYLDREEE